MCFRLGLSEGLYDREPSSTMQPHLLYSLPKLSSTEWKITIELGVDR